MYMKTELSSNIFCDGLSICSHVFFIYIYSVKKPKSVEFKVFEM